MARFSLKWLFLSVAVIGLLITAVLHPTRSTVFASCLVMVGLCSFSAFRGLLHGRKATFSIGFAITAAFCYTTDLPIDALEFIDSPSLFIEDRTDLRRRKIAEHMFTVVLSSIGGIAALYYERRWSGSEEKTMAQP